MNGVTSVLAFLRKRLFALFLLHPYSIAVRKEYWRLITADFVHVDSVHLAMNTFLLYVFASDVEEFLRHAGKWGSLYFLLAYLICLFIGNGLTTFRHRHDRRYTSAGASGTTTGLLFSLMVMNPHGHVLSLAIIGNIENIYLGPIYIGLLAVYKWRRAHDLINHDLHFFGAVGGVLAGILLKFVVL